MPTSEIRKEARKSLNGKWGKAALIVLVYFLFTFVFGLIEDSFPENSGIQSLLSLIMFIASVPITFGITISFMKLRKNEEVHCFDFFKEGFSRFGKSWGVWFNTFLRLLLPVICFVLVLGLLITLIFFREFNAYNISSFLVIGLISVVLYIASLVYIVSRALLYSLSYYIAYDNPELSSKECVLKSETLMKGNRGTYFLLQLSFIGWAILSCISLGIGFLFLLPYVQVASICFYDKLSEKKDNEPIKETK